MSDATVPYSQLRQQRRLDLAASLPLAMPLAMHVETSNICNFACRMCPVSFPDYEQVVGGLTSLPFDIIDRMFADLTAAGGQLKTLKLYGEGEPLVRKDIAAVIEAARGRGAAERIEITTNGSALTGRVARQLIASGLTYLRVSIYGVTEEQHRFVTQSKVPLATIRKNVERMQALKRELGATHPIVYVKLIDRGASEENRLFREQYAGIADEIAIEPGMNWNSYEERDLVQVTSLARPTRSERRVCPYPFYTLVVKANGDVVCCCVDWNKHTRVGNLHERGIMQIWNGPELRAFRLQHLRGERAANPSCRSCTFFHESPDNLDALPEGQFERVIG